METFDPRVYAEFSTLVISHMLKGQVTEAQMMVLTQPHKDRALFAVLAIMAGIVRGVARAQGLDEQTAVREMIKFTETI